jgi:hypothetical protein
MDRVDWAKFGEALTVHAALQPENAVPIGFGVSAKSVYRVVGMKSQSSSEDPHSVSSLRIT